MGKAGGIRAGKAYVEVGADDTQLQRTLKRSSDRLYAFGAAAQRAGMGLLKASAAITAPLVGGVVVFATFEDRMARVKALTGATGDAFASLSDKAQQLGKSTVFSASQAAEAMGYFALAGYDTQRILTAIGPTLDLAAAGQLEVAEAADIAAKIMAGLGLEASELGRAVDVLAAAFTTANTDLPMLGEAMRYIGPIAKQAGWGLEETVAAVQLLSNAGIQGEQAGSALRGALLQLTSPSKEAAGILKELGIQVSDAEGNVRPLAAIIRDLNAAMSGMGSAEQLKAFGTIFSARQVTGMSELLSQGADQLENYTDALHKAGGTAKRVADVQLDTLKGATKLLTSALEGLGIAVGQTLAPALRAVLAPVTAATAALADFADKHRGLTIAVAALAVGLGALGVALVSVGIVAKIAAIGVTGYGIAVGMAAKMTALWAARTGMLVTALLTLAAHPLVAVAVGVAAVALAFGATSRQASDLRTELDKTAYSLHDVAEGIEHMSAAARQAELATLEKQIVALKDEWADLAEQMAVVGGGGVAGVTAESLAAGLGVREGIEKARDEVHRKLDVLTRRRAALRAGVPGEEAAPGGVGRAGTLGGAEETGQRRADLAANWARKVHQLRIRMGADEHQRALELIEERYQHETLQADKRNASEKEHQNIKTAFLLECDLLDREYAERSQGEHRRLEHDLEVAKLQNIENVYDRERALIGARYDYEIAEASRLGDKRQVALLEAIEAAELEGASAREATRQWEIARTIRQADQAQLERVEDLRLRTQLRGVELERALLGLQRSRALEAAKAAGENLAQVAEEYDLRQQLLDMRGGGGERLRVTGTFSAAAARGASRGDARAQRSREIMATRLSQMVKIMSTMESQQRLLGRYT